MAVVLAWTGGIAATALVMPTRWRRWAWPLSSVARHLLGGSGVGVATVSRREWGVSFDRVFLLNLLSTAVVEAFRQVLAVVVVLTIVVLLLSGPLLPSVPTRPAAPSSRPAIVAGCCQRCLGRLGERAAGDGRRWTTAPYGTARFRRGSGYGIRSSVPGYSSGHSMFRATLERERSAQRDREAAEVRYPAPNPRRRIVLVVMDALRSDRLPFYGYARDTAPFWSDLRRQGHWAQVERAYGTGPESVGGISGIFQPHWPRSRSGQGRGIGQQLRRHGFRTHFFVTGSHAALGLRDTYGDADTFSSGVERAQRGWRFPDDEGVLADLATLPQAPVDGMDFIFIHFMSTHEAGIRNLRFAQWQPTLPLRNMFLSRHISEGDAGALRNEYDNRILQADDELRRAWSMLREKGYLRDAIVAIVSDHGQALGEAGRWGHLRDLTEGLLRVPITFWSDSSMRIPTDRLTSLIDVGPTLLAEAGVPVLSSWDGVALRPEAPSRTVVAAEDIMFDMHWAGLIGDSPAGRYRYTRRSQGSAAPEVEHLFELNNDQAEGKDVFPAATADRRAALRRIASEYLGD